MAAPTTQFNQFNIALAATALDSAVERLAISSPISTGVGNELDFGSVNISGGQVNSAVKAMAWKVSAWNSNTVVENFRFWLSSNGFDDANTVIKYATWKLNAPSEWVQNAVYTDVGNTSLPEAEPAQNVFKANDGTTASITSASDDTSEAVAMYAYVGAAESTGTFKGTDAGFQLQYSWKYDYY